MQGKINSEQAEIAVSAAATAYESVYPDMYYKMQPFIVSACDQMDRYEYSAPTRVGIQQTSDRLYTEMCKIYPEFTYYAGANAQRFGGRGLFNTFLDILLLNELFGRRRY